MNGKLHFLDAASLAKFLKEFTGSTATFVVKQYGDEFELEFTGGF